ncbi:hypothetical protein ACFYKX_04930 [Cytobacillus sp. FJAT-54145]|uniref:Uncharacterized protein n=1 Tax=Cytobacillus spartinae TaxID=3299023 RepID=A0ABW6K9L4_9BACI
MEGKPIHYDGSVINNSESSNYQPESNSPFILTDEMRKNISGNPYTIEN